MRNGLKHGNYGSNFRSGKRSNFVADERKISICDSSFGTRTGSKNNAEKIIRNIRSFFKWVWWFAQDLSCIFTRLCSIAFRSVSWPTLVGYFRAAYDPDNADAAAPVLCSLPTVTSNRTPQGVEPGRNRLLIGLFSPEPMQCLAAFSPSHVPSIGFHHFGANYEDQWHARLSKVAWE